MNKYLQTQEVKNALENRKHLERIQTFSNAPVLFLCPVSIFIFTCRLGCTMAMMFPLVSLGQSILSETRNTSTVQGGNSMPTEHIENSIPVTICTYYILWFCVVRWVEHGITAVIVTVATHPKNVCIHVTERRFW